MTSRVSRIEFTKEMKETYTILFPNMVDIHFRLLKRILNSYGYKAEILKNDSPSVVEEGLKYVHNDTCYPALLIIGQMIDALKSGKYDLNHVALAITQTGGGCRASNYIFLLRKALKDAGFGQIPVISLNLGGMEANSGFKITLPMIGRMLSAMAYGDLLMLLLNQTKPYEVKAGTSNDIVEKWIGLLSHEFVNGKGYQSADMKNNFSKIIEDFTQVLKTDEVKVKVGIVGEIYAKYSSLANSHLEEFLFDQDCEIMVPGILQFFLYTADMAVEDIRLYGGSLAKKAMSEAVYKYLERYETMLVESLQSTEYVIPAKYKELKEMARPFIGTGCKMGEGFLLTAEMLELTEKGYGNIVCAQPFGCLPNHIAGKAMMHKIRKVYTDSNIVAIDYDASAAKVNQENRIKLMLSIARENLAVKSSRKDNEEDFKPSRVLQTARS